MVRIKICDLHSHVDESLLNEITHREIKAVEGGVVGRQYPYPDTFYGNDIPNTDNTDNKTSNDTSVASTLRQVNGLVDNLRLELDKIFGRL
ncbi:hypothetical protein I8748_23555 [Nostoc sp. CENA67]|uniref:Uncharacterized protein n=1 Tax=Amazonocrinis nigriterrae CENA67 TaxID=2794033 RepID=A0A8J7HSY0_9NOST|nr:hypothetical protein [Amazonocrinis nigriterrae]MBH8565122.1 hypothetical protein [Amazonocrinis nigriterrae CENA67]